MATIKEILHIAGKWVYICLMVAIIIDLIVKIEQ